MRRAFGLVLLVGFAAGCSDNPLNHREAPSFTTIGTTSTVSGFYFLPPLGATPTPTGDFNADLPIVIAVCQVNGAACDPVVSFNRYTSTPLVEVSETEEHYKVNWKLNDFNLTVGTYRITVGTALGEYGSTQLTVEANGSVKNEAGEQVATTSQTLPIKVRAEFGVDCPDCVIQGTVYPDRDNTLYDENNNVGVFVRQGAVLVPTILQVEPYDEPANGPCLQTHYPQFLGCYTFTKPDGTVFQTLPGGAYPVEVIFCVEDAATPFVDELQLWRSEFDDGSQPAPLDRIITQLTQLSCDDFNPVATTGGVNRILAGMNRMLRPVLDAISPNVAYASARRGGTPTFGGGSFDFSRIGWVRPLDLAKVGGDNQTAIINTAVNQEPTVKVTSQFTSLTAARRPFGTGNPVAGVPITFTPSGGTATPTSAVTGATGLASTHWVLGGATGGYTLQVDAYNWVDTWPNWHPLGVWGSVTFNANAVLPPPYVAVFLAPIGEEKNAPGTALTNVGPLTVEVCLLDGQTDDCVLGAPLFSATVTVSNRTYSANWNSPTDLTPGPFYRARVLQSGVELTRLPLKAVAGGSKTKEPFTFEIGRTVPLKWYVIQ